MAKCLLYKFEYMRMEKYIYIYYNSILYIMVLLSRFADQQLNGLSDESTSTIICVYLVERISGHWIKSICK